jgi:3-phenylpropionate/trans-cinnamate dioxygenase ferredoxin subunit
MSKHVVARIGEIPPGGRKIVRVEGREVGIFNLDGEFYALKNSCPHQAARVSGPRRRHDPAVGGL